MVALTLALVGGCSPQTPRTAQDDPGPGSKAEPTDTITTPETPTMASQSRITLEDIATYPLPGTATPGALRFSPDGRWLTWLDSADDSLSRELFALELAEAESGELRRVVEPPDGGVSEDKLSPEEKLARERKRMRALGVTSYAWARFADRLLIPLTGEVWVQDGVDGQLRRVVAKTEADPRPALNPTLSPDGRQVAFVRGAELWVVDADPDQADSEPRQLTKGVEPGKTRGLPEYIAAEEMGRHSGYWWAPDGSALAFVEVDETHIPGYRIVHQGKDEVGDAAQEDHGYPFAGADNARVRLGVVPSRGGPVRWLELDVPEWTERGGPWTQDPARDIYLARVDWKPDGSLCVQVEDRRQQELRLLCFEGAKGPAKTLIQERSDVWINLHNMFKPLELDEATAAAHPEQVGGFIWASESSGFMHLSLHAADGHKLAQLTSGEWMVEGISEIDEAGQKLWFSATKDDPRERHYYEVGFDGQGLRKLTEAPGMHGLAIDRDHRFYVDVHSSPESPPTVTLHRLDDGARLRTLHPASPEDVDPRVAKLALAPPKFVELDAADGQTTLYGALYQPDPAVHGPGPYPTVISVYGGPHAQRVNRSWGATVDLRAQYLRDHGYLVFKLDNRGAARRGLAFEGALRHDMGKVEIEDQVAGVEWLVAQGLSDPERVAIYGWSYGGYMAAMALARAPKTFAVGIAGAPVTHWDGYDTHYTERYMGLPQENPEGYARSSVMAHVDAIEGKLLLVHGLIDENVHFRHTARLINALIGAGKVYELQLYPDERHMPRKLEDRVYMERRIFEFLTNNL
ncbi:S9 family peptidase [Enhygromyxa salina]|uniref:S9 family peptidase n=1 Tax=Enhygromyxa salina TaxID=215803 RepID=UPI00215967F3|nr:S9 family peptidase [Enhygromyxa salina]